MKLGKKGKIGKAILICELKENWLLGTVLVEGNHPN